MDKRYQSWLLKIALSLVVMIFSMFLISDSYARMMETSGDSTNVPTSGDKPGLPNPQQRVHRTSDIRTCMTNWGFLGSQTRDLKESMGGCFNPNPNVETAAPSFEYPAESGLEYLFQGALWIGAIVDNHPYTSIGCDGWFWVYELWPDGPSPRGIILEGSTRSNVWCYSPDALSEQDIIAVYTDSSADIPLSPEPRDPWDNRRHFPLGIRVTQKSYSWDTEGYDKFIIAEYNFENIGIHFLSDLYVGFYMDTDINHIDENPYGPCGAQDDITGFLRVYEGDTVNIAWAADNDGHGIAGEQTWTQFSPRSVLGMKVLHSSNPNVQLSYNWWNSSQSGYPRDWGPWKQESQVRWAQENCYIPGDSTFPDGVLGTPGGDCSKYFIMSNGEIDYDQIYACVWPDDHPDEGWLPPSPLCADLANGFDTRFLLSFGPFDQLDPGDSLNFAVAYVIGETLHVDPLNLVHDPNMSNPDLYYSHLNFNNLVKNAIIAESLYYRDVFNYPPDSFSLLYPPNKAFTPRKVHFNWETATDSNPSDRVTYELYISRSYHFNPESTIVYKYLYDSQKFVKLNYGIYYWKVKAKDGRGGERWSDGVRYFIATGIHYLNAGDFNQDGFVDVGDVVFAINYLFREGPEPDPLDSGDVNCDENVDAGDVVFMINYLFKNAESPCTH
jgi:hypothetical protein